MRAANSAFYVGSSIRDVMSQLLAFEELHEAMANDVFMSDAADSIVATLNRLLESQCQVGRSAKEFFYLHALHSVVKRSPSN